MRCENSRAIPHPHKQALQLLQGAGQPKVRDDSSSFDSHLPDRLDVMRGLTG